MKEYLQLLDKSFKFGHMTEASQHKHYLGEQIQLYKLNIIQVSLICFAQLVIKINAGFDRSIILYDTRGNTPINRTFLTNKSNTICWNPQEPINFTVGNDDSNCYSFDMRKLDKIKMIHKDHIGPV